MPSKIGRVFFSKGVASPFFTFRMLRHGYLHSPIPWREISIEGVRGLLIIHDESQKPDVVIYYCHGGGFSMGSAYFYLEPLLALQTLLKGQFKNPAIMALDYDLVPDASYPTQLEQTGAGYDYTLSLVDNDASCICVAGDSAGATLVLSLLLNIACGQDYATRRPGYATLISPWISLVSSNNRNTPSDFLNAQSLELYGRQYAGSQENLFDPLVSPGSCTDLRWWAQAVPANGIYITYGSEEVLGPETRNLVHRLRKGGVKVSVKEESGLIHAWVIARLFLEETMEERVKGMRELVKMVRRNIRAA
ncbi:hypothetical protein MMC19_004753 [Ptychographa xylographoides]|nr:hypothetical protein [Ptychographa xylographoides]